MKLLNIRESHFWTISYVSQCTHISAASISAYEQGRYLPTLANLCILADFYGVSADYLLDRVSTPHGIYPEKAKRQR
ncbi:MAG: helix-turn-helix domain-containing protein [Lachnospiraceae bacterium]|nr:helix-turn-helix domain-containing protein [Lachnospiraceae bacterium]